MKKLVLFIAVLVACSTQAQVMRTIIFSDTNDQSIGQGCSSDLSEMSAFGIQLATALGMSSSYAPPIVARGGNCSKDRLISVLNNFECTDKDLVVFFYSGHGARSYDEKSEFPQMCLGSSDQSKFVPLDYVRTELRKHNPAFLLILADCCNKPSVYVEDKRDHLFERPLSKGPVATHIPTYTSEVLKKMFFSQKGFVMASGCKKGEFSWTATSGGYFTIGFLDEFANYVNISKNDYTWEGLMQNVHRNVLDRTHRAMRYQNDMTEQHPIWMIRLTGQGFNPIGYQIEDGIRTALIRLADEQAYNPKERINMMSRVQKDWFADDAIVEQCSPDGKIVVGQSDVAAYLLHVATTFNLKNFIVCEQKKNANGKITYLKLNEIYID
jgi:hypothetical protein